MTPRFTLDGSQALEERLATLCTAAASKVRGLLGSRFHGLVLGGGYGRGEGGVLHTASGEHPYNDLEFYVFAHGVRLLNDRALAAPLHKIGEELSLPTLHVEFKVESLRRFSRAPVSMFSYDLVAGHRVIVGPQDLLQPASHHLDSTAIPLCEATRLLFNRFTGLLFTREHLTRPTLSPEAADFCTRNLAKAELALGDALLVAKGHYHWSCPQRNNRLGTLNVPEIDVLPEIRLRHARAVKFKLHPWLGNARREVLLTEFDKVADLGRTIWLWLESLRLRCTYQTPVEYALCRRAKCPEVPFWRNLALNWRSFGPQGLLSSMAVRYPRERLLKALPLLLWSEPDEIRPENVRHLQTQLGTEARDWSGFVAAYKSLWPAYG